MRGIGNIFGAIPAFVSGYLSFGVIIELVVLKHIFQRIDSGECSVFHKIYCGVGDEAI